MPIALSTDLNRYKDEWFITLISLQIHPCSILKVTFKLFQVFSYQLIEHHYCDYGKGKRNAAL
jgi:hypothetical protein